MAPAKEVAPAPVEKPKAKKVRKFRLMHGKHADVTKNYAKGDVVTIAYDDYNGDHRDEDAKRDYHDRHDLSKLHVGEFGNPRFVEFEGDALPPLKEEQAPAHPII